MEYIELDSKSALNKLKRRIPYSYDLNIYRGCEHGCKYCYAIYSHDYLNDNNFFDKVYYKKNILEHLEKELSSPNWKREIVNIGGVTDSYQSIEEKLEIMPEVLKLMIKYKTPVIISTKSDLILKDIDLIDKLSRITYVNNKQVSVECHRAISHFYNKGYEVMGHAATGHDAQYSSPEEFYSWIMGKRRGV